MIKLLSTLLIALAATSTATAQSLSDYAENGETRIFGQDFNYAMQGELDAALVGVSSSIADNASTASNNLSEAVSGINDAIGDMQYGMHVQAELLEAGVAGSTALSMLPQVDGALSISAGSYESGHALAMGYTKSYGDKYLTKFGLSIDNQNNKSFGAGVAIKLGK